MDEQEFIDCGSLRLDVHAYRLRKGQESQALSLTEARLLAFLMTNAGTVLARSDLHRVLSASKGGLTPAISRLRRPLAALGCASCLCAIRGHGYIFLQPD